MKKIIENLFKGRLNRKYYFIFLVIFLFIWAIVLQIARESGTNAYISTFAVLLLLKTILDAKRLRDCDIPGKVAPIFVIIFLLMWIPWTNDAMIDPQASYSVPRILSLFYILLTVGHFYLLLSKGDDIPNKFGDVFSFKK